METSTLHCPADLPTLPAASFSTPAWGAVACLFAVLRFGSSRSIRLIETDQPAELIFLAHVALS